MIGGSERYAAELVPALVARGHAVTVLASAGSAAPAEGTRLLLEPAGGGARPFRRLVREVAPDVILALSAPGEAALRALLESGTPLVRFVQDHVPFCPGLDKVHADGARCASAMGAACLERYVLGAGCVGYRRAHHAGDALAPVTALWKHLRGVELLRRARRVLVASEYMRRELLGVGLPPDQVLTLPYFAPRLAPPGPLPAELAAFAAAGPPLLLTPARLALPDKGLDRLLTALAGLTRPFRAVVAGAGPAEAALRAQARAAGLAERVHFPGWLGERELAALYARARAVVVPSMWDEPFGLVGLEAMSHGRPVAAFAVGGIGEWLADGVTGRLVAPGDTQALAQVLDAWLAEPERADELGRAGRARLEREFTAAGHLERLEAILVR